MVGEIGAQPVEAVQLRKRGVFVGAGCGALAAHAGKQRRGELGCAGEEAGALGVTRAGEGGLEKLAHDPVRERALELAAARRKHAHPARLPHGARLGEQARLADPGSALDRGQPAGAPVRSLDRGRQTFQLGFAFQQLEPGRCAPGPDRREVRGELVHDELEDALGTVEARQRVPAEVAEADVWRQSSMTSSRVTEDRII